jgi:hypothetical protein
VSYLIVITPRVGATIVQGVLVAPDLHRGCTEQPCNHISATKKRLTNFVRRLA